MVALLWVTLAGASEWESECQAAADAESQRLLDVDVRRAVAEAEASMVAEWRALEAAAISASNGDPETRARVEAFVERTRDRVVTLPGGARPIQTGCGERAGFAAPASRPVGQAVHREALALLASYTPDGALAGADAVAGQDATSPTLGVLKWIPPGTFQMGSPSHAAGHSADDAPHAVMLTHGFWMMEREVTQEMWRQVMGDDAAKPTTCGDSCAVTEVTWTDAVEFARRVSETSIGTYRLPTEAEWEWAARGGESEWEDGSLVVLRSGPGCEQPRNGYELCDMTGNVSEWVADWYGAYPTTACTDPDGPAEGWGRVVRGGDTGGHSPLVRVSDRFSLPPSGYSAAFIGFRLVRTVP